MPHLHQRGSQFYVGHSANGPKREFQTWHAGNRPIAPYPHFAHGFHCGGGLAAAGADPTLLAEEPAEPELELVLEIAAGGITLPV